VIAPGDARNRDAAAEFEVKKVLATADVEATPGTLAALAALAARGMRLAVCSNNFQDQVDLFAARCAIRFDLALGFGNGLAKGAPQFDRACAMFGCTRADLVFVGDSLADAELARAAGVRFVGRLGTFSAVAFTGVAPDAPLIREIDELLELFT
jgi:phosphoglycolate phosphatase